MSRRVCVYVYICENLQILVYKSIYFVKGFPYFICIFNFGHDMALSNKVPLLNRDLHEEAREQEDRRQDRDVGWAVGAFTSTNLRVSERRRLEDTSALALSSFMTSWRMTSWRILFPCRMLCSLTRSCNTWQGMW